MTEQIAAPKVTMADIEDNIVSEYYFTAANGVVGAAGTAVELYWYHPQLDRLTFCVLVLTNGFTVVGHSACVSAENFNAEVGRRMARENAIDQLWPLMGYALTERLFKRWGDCGV